MSASNQNWSGYPPDKDGVYWWRRANGYRPQPVRVYDGAAAFCFPYAFSQSVDTIPGEWWPEPIKEPGCV